MKRVIPVFLFLTIFVSAAFAVPIEISYQAYLTDSGGAPVNETTNINFKLYDGLDALQWDSGAVAVDVENGVYSVTLGAVPQPPIDPAIFAQDLWLGITIEGDAEMTPKQKLTSVAFAIHAAAADSVDWANIANKPGGFSDGVDNDSGGTVTQVNAGSGLKGGPITGVGALSIDTAVVPQLNTLNTFSKTQTVISEGGTAKGLVVKSGPGQTANLQEWQNDTGAAMAILDNKGSFTGMQFIATASPGTAPIQVSSTTVAPNLNADLLDSRHASNFVDLNNSQTITGLKTFNAAGTVPFAVDGRNNSTVTNLNADLLDGQHSSEIIAAASDGIPPSWHQIIPAAERFVLVMGGVAVLDRETGLVWQKTPSALTRTRDDAVLDCANLNLGGRKGWHLPTSEQLSSLIDTSASGSPKIPAGSPFTGVQSDTYWTITTHYLIQLGLGYASVVNFSTGDVVTDSLTDYKYKWCVRGGQTYLYDLH